MGGPSVVIAAGGTGGHIYPGLALADAVADAAPDAVITFVGTRRGMEGDLVPKAGRTIRFYDMVPFNGQGWRKSLVPPAMARGALQPRAILRDVHADVAVTMGGYSGVPLVLGARLAGVPSVVHEPGVVPGQANRLAARFTPFIATSFPQTSYPGRTPRYVGYPLRPEMVGFDRDELRPSARAALGLDEHTHLVLVAGASQGSLSLNRLALGLAERWAARDDVRILLKTGARTHDEIVEQLAGNPGRDLVDVVTYIDRMDHAYAAADVGVFRSGAGTVSELAVVGLPSVLVPLPHHEHDEQFHNARPLADTGGAIIVRDHEATAEHVGPMIEERLDDPALLAAMRKGMHAAAKPHAAADLAAWALELAQSMIAPDSLVTDALAELRAGRATVEGGGVLDDVMIRRALLAAADPASVRVSDVLALGEPAEREPSPGATVVVMAGGRGERLRPLTDHLPKPLLAVGRTTILERLLERLFESGFDDVWLAVNYMAEKIETTIGDGSRWGMSVRYLREDEPLHTTGALSLLPQRPAGPIVVLNADQVTQLSFARMVDFHAAEQAAVTVGVFFHEEQVKYGVVDLDGTAVAGIREKPMLRWPCNAGFYVIDPSMIDLIPPGEPFTMPQLVDAALTAGDRVAAFPIVETWLDIGNFEDLNHALLWFVTGEHL